MPKSLALAAALPPTHDQSLTHNRKSSQALENSAPALRKSGDDPSGHPQWEEFKVSAAHAVGGSEDLRWACHHHFPTGEPRFGVAMRRGGMVPRRRSRDANMGDERLRVEGEELRGMALVVLAERVSMQMKASRQEWFLRQVIF